MAGDRLTSGRKDKIGVQGKKWKVRELTRGDRPPGHHESSRARRQQVGIEVRSNRFDSMR